MDIVGGLLFFAGFIAVIIFLIMSFISFIKKNGKAQRQMKFAAGSIVATIVGIILIVNSPDGEPAAEPATSEVSAEAETKEEQKLTAEEEAKLKAEEEAKAKAEAEARAKEEEEAKKKAEQELAEKKANAQTISYPQLKKNPDRHTGEYVKYTGKIIQILEDGDYTNIRLSVTQESYGWDSNDVIFIEYDGLTDYVEDDVVTVYGMIYGEYKYKSQAGWDISLPGLMADSFE
ncbi:Skp family chaperone for outer membrane proteins [Bacillus ectoiniformans]|uniref:O-antigen ligase family protein n=1 Tax=Bacillus ectoiniformans TaxID=1494429 RepID=UPI00195AAD15|nr:hypothetical protein [Bacillus ectoiniformans]MBM7648459.1 Skp family chaperone for outer membrane proteins [Bacillus ectoiniformans]